MSAVLTITDQEFQTTVLESSQPVLVYFWAAWCGPCRLTAPAVEKIAAEFGDRLKVVKMEVDPNRQTVAEYKVEGVPAFRLIKNQKLIAQTEGALPQAKLTEFLNSNLS